LAIAVFTINLIKLRRVQALPLLKSGPTPFQPGVREERNEMATVPELIVERQKEISKGWESFLGHPLHSSIAEVIARKSTKLNADFVPWAPGILIASDRLLRSAGHNPNSRRSPKWRKHRRWGYFMNGPFIVCKRRDFWFVEK
jgi:hypothetical protein